MKLVVTDAAVQATAERAALDVAAVSRLHTPAWSRGPLARGRHRGVELERTADRVLLTVRLVAHRRATVIEVVHTVQQTVRGQLLRLAGVTVEVTVVVVDLD